MKSTLSANAREFIPFTQTPKTVIAEESKYISLELSWIIRSHAYQISTESLIKGLNDSEWHGQSYIFLDASLAYSLSLPQQQQKTESYVLSQREFFINKKITFNRKPSDIYTMGLVSGYTCLDKGAVAMHESGLFSVPYYFGGVVNGLLQIGDVVPLKKLKPVHQCVENLLKAHKSQDLLFLSYINPYDFKSLVCITKLAAHRMYMAQKSYTHGYSLPKWIFSTFGLKHYATLKYGISFELLLESMSAHMKDSNNKFHQIKYNSIIKKFTKNVNFTQFDCKELSKWRANDYQNLHRHKFSLDLLSIEKYETTVALRYKMMNYPDCFTSEDSYALKKLDHVP
jgi:hypothetical protein